MSRAARLHIPGAVVHVISRFVNGEYLLSGPECRAEYLKRLGAVVAQTDWTLLAFALMSTHVHLVLVAGSMAPWRLYQRLNSSFCQWLNRLYSRMGPVVMGRPTTIYLPPERAAGLVAYVHNNPVRARLVPSADETDWTSHRAWLGLDPAPPGLSVRQGLALTGFGAAVDGRADLHHFVVNRSGDPRNSEWSGTTSDRSRAEARAQLALPVELTSPLLDAVGTHTAHGILYPCGMPPVAPRWEGELEVVVRAAAARSGTSVEAMLSRARLPSLVRARRIAAVAGVFFLRRRTIEMAGALAISAGAVSQYLGRADDVITDASEVAAMARSAGDARTGQDGLLLDVGDQRA